MSKIGYCDNCGDGPTKLLGYIGSDCVMDVCPKCHKELAKASTNSFLSTLYYGPYVAGGAIAGVGIGSFASGGNMTVVSVVMLIVAVIAAIVGKILRYRGKFLPKLIGLAVLVGGALLGLLFMKLGM